MSSAGALTAAETRVIDGLAKLGVARETATLGVVLWTRRHLRPEEELLDLVSNYPRLDQEDSRRRALTDARDRGWVLDVPSEHSGPALVQAAPDLGTVLAGHLPDDLQRALELARRTDDSVKVLGHMGTPTVYDTYAERLEQARSDIALPMLMTTDRLNAIDVLKARADAGVIVRVLLATPTLAGEIRGRSVVATAKARLKGWKLQAKGHRNLHLRVTRHRRDIRDATSMLIDGHMLRYDVYDDETERTTDGVMLEVAGDRPTNLTRMVADRFDEAWSRARPLGFWRSVGWAIKRWWWVLALVAFITLSVLLHKKHPTIAVLILGAVIGYFVDHLDSIMHRLRELWARLRT